VLAVDVFEVEVLPVVFVVFDPELAPAVFALELLTVPGVFVVLVLELVPVLFEPEFVELRLVVEYWLVLPVLCDI
jgi:hypothetical protein